MSPPLPVVTDHAIVRYLERVMGFDIEGVRRHIAEVCAGPIAAGATAFKAEGVKFCLANNNVVTVAPLNPTPSKTERLRAQIKIAEARQ